MDHAAEFRRCLMECDVDGVARLWMYVCPHLPQPKSRLETLITIHHARTQAQSLSLRLRAYSHRWLIDNGYPSALPDELKPKAERMYPRIVEAVGIAVKATSPERVPHARALQAAMSDAVLEAYAEKVTDPTIVKARMMQARRNFLRAN